MTTIFAANSKTQAFSTISKTCRPNRVFEAIQDRPAEGHTHHFRSVRDPELMSFTDPRFSIGPHTFDTRDEAATIFQAGAYRGDVYGFWFDKNVHRDESDNDDDFYYIARGLTPDNIDNWSKAKIIKQFCLSPLRGGGYNWRPHFGSEWLNMYEAVSDEPCLNAFLEAEKSLKDIREKMGKQVRDTLNMYPLIMAMMYMGENSISIVPSEAEKILTPEFLRKVAFLSDKGHEFGSFFSVIGSGHLITDTLMGMFLPVDIEAKKAKLNLRNSLNLASFIMNLDPETVKRKMDEKAYRSPVLRLLSTVADNPPEQVLPGIFKVEI